MSPMSPKTHRFFAPEKAALQVTIVSDADSDELREAIRSGSILSL